MAINLTKYKDALQAAWKDVLDDKTPTDWALFGYDGQTNDLKFVSKGPGGIEEMADDLNSGKIMYAFCKVLDPKTSLPKCVLINWQGEGAPLVRKGTCANHIRDVSNFFKGAHLTVNARNEEEVDSQLIIDKVAKSTGSVYSFKERAEVNEHVAPIGTSYKKVIPTQEINSKERDKFWERAEQEEKQRQEEERKRREEERCKLESEQKQRELVEAQIRDERAKERNRNINQLRQAEQHANSREQEKVVSAAEELAEREREEQERKGRSELLRRQRSQEAQAVISQRTINARAVFEQNTAAGQMHNTRQQKAEVFSPTLAARLSPQLQSPLVEQSEEPEIHIETPEMYTDKQHYNTTVQQDLPVETVRTEEHIKENTSWRDNNNMQTTLTDEINKQVKEPVPEQTVEDILSYEPIQLDSDLGLQARALYDYQAADPTEITFDPGDIISHIDQIDEGWWQGLGPDGTFGLFPANYVELIN